MATTVPIFGINFLQRDHRDDTDSRTSSKMKNGILIYIRLANKVCTINTFIQKGTLLEQWFKL